MNQVIIPADLHQKAPLFMATVKGTGLLLIIAAAFLGLYIGLSQFYIQLQKVQVKKKTSPINAVKKPEGTFVKISILICVITLLLIITLGVYYYSKFKNKPSFILFMLVIFFIVSLVIIGVNIKFLNQEIDPCPPGYTQDDDDKSQCELTEDFVAFPLMNILTRTGYREYHYKRLLDSIQSQTYKNIRHLKSCDNPHCTYLDFENDTNIVKVKKNKKLTRFYNLYLNNLGAKVNNGWIMILDDDCKLISPTFIEELAEECQRSKPEDILLYQTYIGASKTVIPPDEYLNQKLIRRKYIDMSCFCVHYTVLKTEKFNATLAGDFKFLKMLLKKKKYKLKWLTLKPGIWANYDGQKMGKDIAVADLLYGSDED